MTADLVNPAIKQVSGVVLPNLYGDIITDRPPGDSGRRRYRQAAPISATITRCLKLFIRAAYGRGAGGLREPAESIFKATEMLARII